MSKGGKARQTESGELLVCSNGRALRDYVEHKMTGSVYAVRNTWVAPDENPAAG